MGRAGRWRSALVSFLTTCHIYSILLVRVKRNLVVELFIFVAREIGVFFAPADNDVVKCH